jgi:glyoxylase-like metal-dependent hydrolase (beta-lactamase superfamily II)
MKRTSLLLAALSLAATLSAQNAKSVLETAQKALGDAKSVEFTGTGMNAFYGQALTAGKEWPRRDLESMKGAINFDQKSALFELNFKNAVFGGQRQNQYVNGDKAWTVTPNGANAQIATAEARQLAIWMTPHGFIKAALAAGNATAKSKSEGGKKVNVVSFTAMNKFKLEGTIDSTGMVTKVATKVGDTVLGDTPLVFTYADYKDFSGVKFPTKITQSQGGFAVNEFNVASVTPNANVNLPVPANVASATIPAVQVQSNKVADGVWFVGGGSHHSVLVEFPTYLTVIEGPLNDDRSKAVIAEVKKLVPNKPIKYVVSTHHHFDHSGGLRTYVAEGATVVTHASNKAYFEKSFVAPSTIAPDAQSTAKKKPSIVTFTDKYVLSDGNQKIEIYNTPGDDHTDEINVVYIPSAKVLVEADSFSPGPPNAPAPNPAPKNAVVLYDAVKKLNLNVETVIGIHGRGPVPFAELAKFVGKAN